MVECPRCFWLEMNEGRKRPDGIFPSLPNGIDHVLKAHFDRFRGKGELPPDLKGVDAELFADTELLDVWRNNRKGIVFNDENDNTIKGAVDEILQKGSKLIVLDFKTRGFPLKEDTAAHYQLQLDIYNFLLRKIGHETEDYAYLLFYTPREIGKNGEFVFNSELVKMAISVKDAEKAISKALQTLQGPIPEPSVSCKYCEWANGKG